MERSSNSKCGRGSHNAEGEHVLTKPMEGWVKVNTDTTLVSDGSVGVRRIMRDSHGGFLGVRCCKRVGANQRCIMETDS